MRFADITNVNEEIITGVENTIKNDFNTLFSIDHAKTIAGLLDNLDRKHRSTYTKELEKRDKVLAYEVKKKMFSFESIISIDDSGVQIIFRNVDKNTLAIALKGADHKVQSLFFKNISERATNIIRGDMEGHGPLGMEKIEEAQHQIALKAKELLLNKVVHRKEPK